MVACRDPWRNKEPCQNVAKEPRNLQRVFGSVTEDGDHTSAETYLLLSCLLSAETEGYTPTRVVEFLVLRSQDILKVGHPQPSLRPVQVQSGCTGAVLNGRSSPCGVK